MLQQRRENQGIYKPPPIWSDLDVPEEVEEEDALEVLGRRIADKGKSLWRRVASKGNSSGKHATVTSGDVNEETVTTTHEEEHHDAAFPSGSLESSLPSDPPNRTLELSNNNGGDTVKHSLQTDSL